MVEYLKPQLLALSWMLLQAVLLHTLDVCARHTRNFWLISIAMLIAATLYAGTSIWSLRQWPNGRNWWFYYPFYVAYFSSTFDIFTFLEVWTQQKNFLLTQYLGMDAPHLHNHSVLSFAYLDVVFLHFVNSICLHRLLNGQSFRSLMLFSSSGYAFVTIVYLTVLFNTTAPRHPFEVLGMFLTNVYVAPVIVLLVSPKSYDFKPDLPNKSDRARTKFLSNLASVLLGLSLAINVAKTLVVFELDNTLLDVFRKNDPILLLDDVAHAARSPVVHMCFTLLLIAPIIFICIWHNMRQQRPLYLWDLSVVHVGLACWGQFYFIWNAIFPVDTRLPPIYQRHDLHGDWDNLIFWAINLTPLTASLVQLASLVPFKVSTKDVTPTAKVKSQ